ncbi:hypothetical protein CVT25_013632 [Psilocybe cyanescens]|uniref:Fungal-type protein kinase domain-containing protein n=1 Tax=Psilocybe cyanescens TaxID=93625 RepID=A0A409WTA9_PSICY|nr:hypothetical protein CVT25_013632 [Psilocybe cyanescens]
MSLPEKCKISAFDYKKLATACASLHNFRATITTEESEGDPNEPLDIALLDAVLSHLQLTLSGPQNELWSSEGFHRHLEMLENMMPNVKKTSARAWIDTFFYCVCAMLPKDRHMVLNMEHHGLSKTDETSNMIIHRPSGDIDYTVVVADADTLQGKSCCRLVSTCQLIFLSRIHSKSHLQARNTFTGFFVVEAEFINIRQHIPQAICKMYACGKYLQKKVICGALMNGCQWIFLILNINDNFIGGSYKYSLIISIMSMVSDSQQDMICPLWPNFIAATLLHWVGLIPIFFVICLTSQDGRLKIALWTFPLMTGSSMIGDDAT